MGRVWLFGTSYEQFLRGLELVLSDFLGFRLVSMWLQMVSGGFLVVTNGFKLFCVVLNGFS